MSPYVGLNIKGSQYSKNQFQLYNPDSDTREESSLSHKMTSVPLILHCSYYCSGIINQSFLPPSLCNLLDLELEEHDSLHHLSGQMQESYTFSHCSLSIFPLILFYIPNFEHLLIFACLLVYCILLCLQKLNTIALPSPFVIHNNSVRQVRLQEATGNTSGEFL